MKIELWSHMEQKLNCFLTFSKYFLCQMGLLDLLNEKRFETISVNPRMNLPKNHTLWPTLIKRRNQRNFYEGTHALAIGLQKRTQASKLWMQWQSWYVAKWALSNGIIIYAFTTYNEMHVGFASFAGIIKMHVLYGNMHGAEIRCCTILNIFHLEMMYKWMLNELFFSWVLT